MLRVARAGNILVIIENATLDDKSQAWLSKAVYQPLPHYQWGPAPPPTTSEASDPPGS